MTHLLITTGPESSGKTTLATQLGASLRAPVVGEAARDYLNEIYRRKPGYQYQPDDILQIARLQHAREQATLQAKPPLLVCDTDLLVLIVWSEVKYGKADPRITSLFEQSRRGSRRTYLLCDHDIPWQPDPLREHPEERQMLSDRYLAKLRTLGLPYLRVCGSEQERLDRVRRSIASW